MRKFLLSLATAVLAASGAMAAEASFTFTGSGAAYGLTRQTANNPTAIEDPFVLTEQGVELTFSAGGNGGWALAYNKMVTYSGMQLLTTGSNHALTISAPGGIISQVVLTLNNSMSVTVDGNTESTNTYTWEGAKNSVEFTFGTPAARTYIKTLEITYATGSADQKEPGLSFSEEKVSAVYGEAFTAPTLLNPNNLPVTWSSSKTTVATVDETGAVTLVGGGTTTITAFTEGNDEYASGFASYELSVTPVATSAAQLLTMAPAVSDLVKIDFPITVTYASSGEETIWGIDAEGNALAVKAVFSKDAYKVGSVIPAGWIAANNTSNGNVTWTGAVPAAEAATVEVVYPETTVITAADAAKVVWLKSVVFAEPTPSNGVSVNLTVADQPIVVMNFLGAPQEPAGAYDVLGVVSTRVLGSNESVYFYPIEYKAGEAPKPMVEKNTSIDFTKALGATSNSVAKIDPLPYAIASAPVTVTLTEAAQAYYYSTNGVQVRPVSLSVEGTSKMTISTDGRQIKKIELVAGWIDPMVVNGTTLPEGKYDSTLRNYVYTWEAPAAFTEDNVEVEMTVSGNQWLKTLTVYYLEEGSGLIYPDLSFVKDEVSVSLAEKTYDLSSNLKNPNDAPVVWTSSDEAVATVEGSIATLKSEGSVTLTATVDDPAYDPEEVSFTLNVENIAYTVEQMDILAPEAGDKVKIASTLGFYVAGFLNGTYKVDVEGTDEEGNPTVTSKTEYEAYAFVEDAKGNPLLFYKTSSTSVTLRVNDVIEGGWTATNAATPDVQVWNNFPNPGMQVQGWFGDRQEVETFDGIDEYRTIILENVALEGGVPSEKGLFVGKLSNGTEVGLVNLVSLAAAQKRGIYNISGAMVKNSKGEPVFYPISYKFIEDLPELLPTDFPESLEITTDGSAVTVNQMFDEEEGQLLISVTGATKKETLEVIFTVPEGWDGFYGANMEDLGMPGSVLRAPVVDESWTPVDFMASMNLKPLTSITFKVDKEGTPFAAGLYLYKGDQAYAGASIYLMGQVAYDDPTGVAGIEAVDADAKYYNLQGVEVKNPTPGIYVKVLDGKSSKVILK